MSLKREAISWLLVALLGFAIVYQYFGANKAEERAEQAEAVAKDAEAKFQQFTLESAQREKLAEARYEASLAESAQLRAILAKGSQAPRLNVPPARQEPITAILDSAKGSTTGPKPAEAPQSACQPFIYQGSQLIIEQFQVLVCDQKPVVQAEAAVALHDEKALADKLNTQLAEATAKLALEEQSLDSYKKAEVMWKKAAHKSRIKRALGVAEKVVLFATGAYIGHRL